MRNEIERLTLVRAKAQRLLDRVDSGEYVYDEEGAVVLSEIRTAARATQAAADREALRRVVDGPADPSRPGGVEIGGTLADKLLGAGWNLKSQPYAQVPISAALRFKAGSLDGGSSIEDAVPRRFTSAELGRDERYLHPRLLSQPLDVDATGVQSYRQKSRSLASPANMVRAIAATSAKPETSTVSEVVNEPLKQIASIQTGTPNVLLASANFRQWVNGDLLQAFRSAVDYHALTEIDAASIPTGGGGVNDYEAVLYSLEVVRAAGYEPDVVVVSPNDALTIRLLIMTNESYAFAQTLPSFVVSSSVADGEGFVADASALGTLFIKPFSLAAFEENDGSTNTTTIRGEADGLFLVQRSDAAASIGQVS